jgi:hypothetical protein
MRRASFLPRSPCPLIGLGVVIYVWRFAAELLNEAAADKDTLPDAEAHSAR